ncbi:uncharacterized protein K452DRAFT_290327 [Aplosporella prunicola CBS 121167]|uniref:Hydantoin racemase n=1 Tax=Aplosporella prunicola CBS 121167 TaxID=1176127 RepID=A0A6A6B5W3_9PEZI|nr:uncharacterized protein K452DRAFT_290327 [Aplosporella prunicola CBS 121167]KAF2138675.1 hypothetical protein K452DRAFT_290327 [Aplosporella prunicola CBS 121167]
MATRKSRSILVINPNCTEAMTRGLEPLVNALGLDSATTTCAYFTAPSGIKSINNEADAAASVEHCLPRLLPLLPQHDAFLVACYSPHPLVPLLKCQDDVKRNHKPVTGIFEASVTASLQLVAPDQKFGIVSTGKVWEEILTGAVTAFLGTGETAGKRFAGVETTGLNATELHDAPPDEVRRKMMDATKRLVGGGDVGAVCLGCAGMAGMEEMVREACIEELGEESGKRIRVVDGVQAGVVWLDATMRTDC